jgi:pilus assembly protein CpaC
MMDNMQGISARMGVWGRCLVIWLCFLAGPSLANQSEENESSAKSEKVLNLETSEAHSINFDSGVAEVFIANPEIADVQMNSAKTAYVFGKKSGRTSFIATDQSGKIVKKMDVIVSTSSSELKATLKKLYPTEDIKVYPTPKGVILRGDVSTAKVSKNATDIAKRFTTGENDEIVNELSVTQPTQVMIKVKIAEVNRTVLNSVDINWTATGPMNSMLFGLVQDASAPFSAVNVFRRPSTADASRLGASYLGRNTSLTALIDIVAKEGLGTILAEPNLVAISGETASFLAGGEFPVPVPQNQNVTIEYKEFGISLAFTPTVLSDHQINMRVRPEVSQLDYNNGITYQVGTTGTVQVPGISTRRVDTTVELASGQSFAIAGLFQSNMGNELSEIPGLANVPILGALFRSASFNRKESELVVIVTPYIVEPAKQNDMKSPTQDIRYATQLEGILTGKLTDSYSSEGVSTMDDSSKENGTLRLVGTSGFYHE